MLQHKRFAKKKHVLAIASAISLGFSASALAANVSLSAQSADKALMDLAQQLKVQIVLDKGVATDIKLPALTGDYTLESALSQLLAGTGLKYEFLDDSSVVVSKIDEEADTKSKSAKASASSERNIEEIVKTGSRLITDPGKLTRQMDVITREDIERSGLTRLDEFLNRLPQNVNAPNNIGSSVGIATAGGGLDAIPEFGAGPNAYAGSGINLRGLGAQYTLVLIDGRRPAKGGLFGDIVDISNISLERVEKIEILYDGAAAIYGADAIGGVVNIITNRDYEGTQVSMTLDTTQGGGSARKEFSLGHTQGWESGSLTASVNLRHQDELEGNLRNISFAPAVDFDESYDGEAVLWPSTPANLGAGFGGSPTSSWTYHLMAVADLNGDGDTQDADERIPYDYPVPAGYYPVRTAQVPADYSGAALSLYDIAEDTSVALPAAGASVEDIERIMRQRFPLGDSVYVQAQGYSLLPEEDVRTASLQLRQEVTEKGELNLSYSFTDVEKAMKTANSSHQLYLSPWNSFNPFGAELYMSLDVGNVLPQTTQEIKSKSQHFSGSFSYELTDDWRAEAAMSWSRFRGNTMAKNQFNENAWYDLGYEYGWNYDQDPFKPLFGFGSEEEYVNAFTADRLNKTETTSKDFELTFTGTIAELPAGDVTANFLASRHQEESQVYIEQFGFKNLKSVENVRGDQDAFLDARWGHSRTALGAEVAAPLHESLLFNAVYRNEQYDSTELDTGMWSAGFNWTPQDWVTVRLNRSVGQALPSGVYSRRGGDYIDRLCLFGCGAFWYAEGTTWPPLFSLGRYEKYTLRGSKPGLKAEENTSDMLGFVFRPMDGLTIDLNVSDSKTEGMVGQRQLISGWLSPSMTEPETAPWFVDFVGDDGTFQGVGVDQFGDTLIPGSVVIDERYDNLGNTHIRMADMRVRYTLDTDMGEWRFNLGHQYTAKHEITKPVACWFNQFYGWLDAGVDCNGSDPVTADIVGELNDTYGYPYIRRSLAANPIPKHRSSLSVNWFYKGLSVEAFTGWQSKTKVLVPQVGNGLNEYWITTKPAQSVDLNVVYDFGGGLLDMPDWLRTTRISLGIRNAYYKEAEVTREYKRQDFEAADFKAYENFSSFGLNPRGRTYVLTLNTRF